MIILNMVYLGFDPKTSKKGTSYLIAKFMMGADVFEFYVSAEKMTVVTTIGQLQQFSECKLHLKLRSFNNKAELELDKVEPSK